MNLDNWSWWVGVVCGIVLPMEDRTRDTEWVRRIMAAPPLPDPPRRGHGGRRGGILGALERVGNLGLTIVAIVTLGFLFGSRISRGKDDS